MAAPLPLSSPVTADSPEAIATQESSATPDTPGQTPQSISGSNDEYFTQSGDTLLALAARFGVNPDQITIPPGVPREGLLLPGQKLAIPNILGEVTYGQALLPDSELVYSPSSLDFNLAAFVQDAGGYLSKYSENVDGEELGGAAIIQRVASELSVNPRLLLAILEFRSHLVFGQPGDPRSVDNPVGFYMPGRSGLYQEIMITGTQLNMAFYGWRQGTFLEIEYHKGRRVRLNPMLNAGSIALQHLFALLYREGAWMDALYGSQGFSTLYQHMYGDPWVRAASIGPLFPAGLTQPPLELPFSPGERWSLTAGPHPSWNAGTPRGALDFSPVTGEAVCAVSRSWVTASGSGVIVRSADNAVVLDLDGDGYEQTGWVLVYFHLARKELTLSGLHVEADDTLGHPSCEGGRATGKHVHVARKYNGEWLAADGPLPFVLSGWRAIADERNYYGSLVKGDLIVSSNSSGSRTSIIVR